MNRTLTRMAIDCQWLRRTIESSRPDPFVTLCTHIVRDGEDCVGPFLEDVETGCGLWTQVPPARGPQRHALARG